ncbi:DMT family transporter [Pseudochelatococcus contaminans]|uniref:Drug/metabolite transporter (DMT)-like permease n=1 Tax=Pseudochelatococcus contaminans TaxID=1538103 RepID=A0A7W5Z138_9HYPH|nr:DMT family transporter [Pseudochelatococcus contaminans]MBB3808048.1 drug/metabolite transporter (DMT)-like permease [Pseudochelatococcus contaminans]
MAVVPRRGRDQFAILVLALCWGLNWPAVRTALFELPPWTLRALGMGAGCLFLFAIVCLRGQRLTLMRRDVLPVLAGGALTITAFNLLLAFAQLTAPTSRAVIVTFTMPVWTVIFARIFLGERLDGRRKLALVFGIAGLICLGWPLIVSGTFSYGLLLALLAGMAWALGTIVIKRFPVSTPPMTAVAWQLGAGALVAAIGMVVFEPHVLRDGIDWFNLQERTWIALGYHIVFSQALAYLIWYNLLARLPAGVLSLSTLMVPAIGVISSILLLGEQPTMSDFAGLVLMTAAAGSVMMPPSTRSRVSASASAQSGKA